MASRRLKDDQKTVDPNEDSDEDLENIVYKSSKRPLEAPTPKPISTPAPGKNEENDDDEESSSSGNESDDDDESDSSNSSDEHALDGDSSSDEEEPKDIKGPTKKSKMDKSNKSKPQKDQNDQSSKSTKSDQSKDSKSSFPVKPAKKEKVKKKRSKYVDREGTDSDEEDDEKELPDWRRYWTKKELFGRYLPMKELGRGSYGVVFEGKSTWSSNKLGLSIDTKVAIKKVRRVFNTDTDAKRLLRELKILRTLRGHQSIVKLYDIVPPLDPVNFKTLTIVFEYVDADFSKIFKTNQFFSDLHVQYMMYHMILGINYMHSAGIVHRDLKPANVLINADCSIKICDFGLARGFSEDLALDKKLQKKNRKKKGIQRGLTTHVVTRWYRAPEVILLQQKQASLKAVDMWSVGCIFGELLQMQKDNCSTVWKRGPLFPGDSCFPLSPKRSKKKNAIYQSHFDQIRVIFEVLGTPTKEEIAALDDKQARAYLEDLPKMGGQDLTEMFPSFQKDKNGLDLIRGMLQFDKTKRMTVEQALKHPYFARVRDVDLEAAHPRMKFDFEAVPMKKKELHGLILREVLCYHPKQRAKFEDAGFPMPRRRRAKK